MARQVAIKIIRPGLDSAQIIARFQSERQAIAMMDHPNIAKIFDAGETDDGRPYFVMELVKGIPITEFCDRHNLTLRERIELFIPVCQAVQHAHHKGIIHRDLKPSNILVTLYDEQRVPKVIDFGVAKAVAAKLTEHTLWTDFGMVVGTIEYMSPEQASFNQLDVDTRSDIYSLGVMLYELLAGTPPFTRQEMEQLGIDEMLRCIREEEPYKPSTKLSSSDRLATLAEKRSSAPEGLPAMIRGELDWIVLKALEKNRNRRYESASELAADMQKYLKGEAIGAAPPSFLYKASKFLDRYRSQAIALSLITLALLAGIAGTTIGMLRAWDAEAKALQRYADAESARQQSARLAEKERQARFKANEEAYAKQLALSAEAEQRRFAEEVAEFVVSDILAQTSVEGQNRFGGEGLTRNANLRELLDRAAVKLQERDLAPKTAAELNWIIGVSYRALGFGERAIPFLQESVRLYSKHLGPNHALTLNAQNSLAVAFANARQDDRAIELFRSLWETAREELGEDHEITQRAHCGLAKALLDSGANTEALEHCEKAWRAIATNESATHPEALLAELRYLQAREANDHDDASLDRLLELESRAKERLGNKHEVYLRVSIDVALSLKKAERFQEALERCEYVVGALDRQLGREHPTTMTAKNIYALSLQGDGQLANAIAMFRELADTYQEVFGSEHFSVWHMKNQLGFALHESGDSQNGLELLETSTAQLRQLLNPFDSLLTSCINHLAIALQEVGRHAEAEQLFTEVTEVWNKRQGEQDLDTLIAMNNLAVCRKNLGKIDEAIELYERIVTSSRIKFGDRHTMTLKAQHNLAVAYWKSGNLNKSVPLMELVAATRRSLAPEHRDTVLSVANLAINYHDAGQNARAITELESIVYLSQNYPDLKWVNNTLREYCKEARKLNVLDRLRERYSRNKTTNSPGELIQVFERLSELGSDYLALEEYSRAESTLREALILGEQCAPQSWATNTVQSMLGKALLRQEKFDEARPLLIAGTEGLLQQESSLPKHARPGLVLSIESLIDFYTNTLETAEVERWRKIQSELTK